MAEEKEKKEEVTEDKLSFKTADELSNFLMDLQGQITNLTESVDKLNPVDETTEQEETTDQEKETSEMTDEEVSEIDQLLQSE